MAPEFDQIELSVFGRGFGECIVAHLRNNRWLVVDSLRDSSGMPVALTYLRSIGVSPDAVELLVLTHWHDDHVQGAADIARACKHATVCLPITLCQDEFKRIIVDKADVDTGDFTSGVDELLAVSKVLNGNKARRRWAIANGILLEDETVRIDALSPSHEDVEKFMHAMREWCENGADRRLSKPRRNDTSVALSLKVDNELVLLGADLEVRGSLSGWQAVHEITWGVRGLATFFKVAHHGSITGHYAPVWDDMLAPDPVAVLTPYNRGRKKLPSPEDVNRIRGKSKHAYSAARMAFRKARKQHRSVERTLNEAEIELFRLPEEVGHARFRKRPGAPEWSVELFNSGCRLEDVAA